jgi:tetratricopeptide (TPR) repeat protein
MGGRYNTANYSTYLNDEPMPDAASEKEQVCLPIPAQNPVPISREQNPGLPRPAYLLFPWLCLQGNEFFKQKKFAEAVECYSRSIALSPTAVAFANRAMAYLKLRRQAPTLVEP